MIIDENIDWKPHVHYLQKKLSTAAGIIAKMRHYLKEKNVVALYYVFFHTYLLYGILGWGSATKTTLHPLPILQNKVMRIINKTTVEDHVKNNALYQKYKILKIDDVYKLELGKFMYLYHVNNLPKIFETYFLSIDDAHHYNTRNKSKGKIFCQLC